MTRSGFESLRSIRIGARLSLGFAVIFATMLMGILPAIWQMHFYQGQVGRLSLIDRRVIAVLRVNNQIVDYREKMRAAAEGGHLETFRSVLLPFRARFLQEITEASDALNAAGDETPRLQRTRYTILSYKTAIPAEIDTTLELARFQDWQAIHFRLGKQMLQTSRVMAQIAEEIEESAQAERVSTLRTMEAIRYRVMRVLPIFLIVVLLALGSLVGTGVTRSIAQPLSHLEAGARALGEGNFAHRLEIRGKDELSIVGLAFNRAAAQIEQLHSSLESQVAERTSDLQRANEALRKLSVQDALTGVANRRAFNQSLERELERARESQSVLSLLMVDVDHFKGLNDSYGHQQGDHCLIQVVRALQSVPLRSNDLIARYGGEEFAVVLPGADAPGARIVAERMRLAVTNMVIPNCASMLKILSVSIGVASMWPEAGGSPADLIERADRALYQAKQGGRNCAHAA